MKRYPNLIVGLAFAAASIAILALVGIYAEIRNPDYTVLRQVVMGWPLIVLGAASFAAGLRVAFWAEPAQAATVEEWHEPPTFRAAA